MIFDTDILIWVQRGNTKAARLIEQENTRLLSIQSYMELMQGAQSRQQQLYSQRFIRDFNFTTLPLSENIGHRAAIYVDEYALSHGLRAADALIAATATENHMTLCTSNGKHFRMIKDLDTHLFKP